jgi:uncharacterized protein YjiS (DUF1127 family)
MPAITAFALYGAVTAGRALTALGGRARRGFKQFADRFKNRRDAVRLADLDDRMLADIGLTRCDLRDAYAEPLWRDPTDVLARRSAERRFGRHQPALCRAAAARSDAALPAECYPPTNRSVRYLI